MSAMLSGLVFLLLFVLAVSAAPFLYAAWRRLVSREGELQIWRAMSRCGIAPEEAADEAKLGGAVRRCVMCPSIIECDEWLASGNRDGLAKFCPNAGLFMQLEAQKGLHRTH